MILKLVSRFVLPMLLAFASVVGATSLSWTPGWDYFSQPLNYGSSSVSYTFVSPTSLSVTYQYVGAAPNATDAVGIHMFLPLNTPCAGHTFGQFSESYLCGLATRQGVTANVIAFDFGSVNTDGAGNGSLTVLVTGLNPGTYDIEFDTRDGICCAVMYQSPGPVFADMVQLVVSTTSPEPGSLVLLGSGLLAGIGSLHRKLML